jgi:uncharacterized membrane protein
MAHKKKRRIPNTQYPVRPEPTLSSGDHGEVSPPNVRVASMRTEQRLHLGPLPSPEQLAQYNQVLPGLAERIVAMAEKQSGHRQDIEGRVVRSNIRNATIGQFLAFVLGAGTIGGSIWLVSIGRSLEGVSGVVMAIGSLLWAFVSGKRSQRAELDQKRRGAGRVE